MCAVGITRKLVRELAIDDLLGRKNDPTRDAITTAISFSHGNSRSTAYFGRLKKEREREKKTRFYTQTLWRYGKFGAHVGWRPMQNGQLVTASGSD